MEENQGRNLLNGLIKKGRKQKKKERTEEEKQLYRQRNRRVKRTYYLYGLIILILGIFVIGKATVVYTSEKDRWLELDRNANLPDVVTKPKRGNIFSASNSAMAISVPKYIISMDFRAGGFKDSLFLASVDSLALCLSRDIGGGSKAHYKNVLMDGYRTARKGGKRAKRIIKKEISHLERHMLLQMPYLRIRNKNISGLVEEEVTRRERPYGNTASRTIGNLRPDVDSMGISHGSSGLELEYDSLLCGKPGINAQKRVSGKFVFPVKVPPINGCDIHTTLDVNIQDITERALLEKVKESGARWGTAVVMEVETGEIKAMSNLDKGKDGEYYEVVNHALRDLLEPGSTIKTASVMAVLEDGLATPDEIVDTGNGLWTFNRRVVRDHNAHRGGYGPITVAQSIWYSSNVGVAKTVVKGYGQNYKGFRDRLEKMTLLEPIDLEIPGTAKPYIRPAKDWDKTSIAWISFGYETQIPPIYTLRFYNGIANNGRVMQPFLVRKITRDEETLSETKPSVVKEHMASENTLKEIRSMLEGVVEHGTGKAVKSDKIKIAGKTGTAMISEGSRGYGSAKNITFCGYFPADDPKYSAIVVVNRPQSGGAGGICGGVVKSIAEQIQATTMYSELKDLKPDSTATMKMKIYGGRGDAIENAYKYLVEKDSAERGKGKNNWFVYKTDSTGIQVPQELELKENLVPSLVGLMPIDACYLAGKAGLSVQVRGSGPRVASQSIRAGSKVTNGAQIVLTLR